MCQNKLSTPLDSLATWFSEFDINSILSSSHLSSCWSLSALFVNSDNTVREFVCNCLNVGKRRLLKAALKFLKIPLHFVSSMARCQRYPLVVVAARARTSSKSSCPHQGSPELRVEPEVENGVRTHRCLGHDGGDGTQSIRNLMYDFQVFISHFLNSGFYWYIIRYIDKPKSKSQDLGCV